MPFVHTRRFHRNKLPHWEVEQGRYFVTVRLSDSLPRHVVQELQEVRASLVEIEAQSEQFAAMQRRYFRTLERYLDAGVGCCCLRDAPTASIVLDELKALRDWHIEAPHFSVMPNHWHAIVVPDATCEYSLSSVMKRLKGRSAKRIRQSVGGKGPLWQCEWFDRWIRDDAEWEKTVRYIRDKPVKAGLVSHWEEHTWTR